MNRTVWLALAVLLVACDEGTTEGGDTADVGTDLGPDVADFGTDPGADDAAGSITLSGTLVEGIQTAGSKAPGDPLVGHRLYCVTFADPPTAATGTADATGQVTIDIGAAGVAFGCFVLDPAGAGLATLIFSDGVETGQTITLTEDTDLGTITVDVDNGIAEADAGGGTLTGSTDFTCPLGTWTVTVPRPDCTGTATSEFWIAQTSDGQYHLGFTFGPIDIPDVGCAYRAEADVPVSESGVALTFTIPADPSCPTKTMTVTMTPNAACTEMAMTSTYNGCASCDGGTCTCGGTLSCPMSPSTAVRH